MQVFGPGLKFFRLNAGISVFKTAFGVRNRRKTLWDGAFIGIFSTPKRSAQTQFFGLNAVRPLPDQ